MTGVSAFDLLVTAPLAGSNVPRALRDIVAERTTEE